MGGESRIFYAKLVFGIAFIAAGIAAGQMVDQRLMLLAMFPAVALLSGVIATLTAPRSPERPETEQPPSLSAAERELMAAVWNAGDLGATGAAQRTSLSEPEATSVLSGLVDKGYLQAREAGGAPVYRRAVRPSG